MMKKKKWSVPVLVLAFSTTIGVAAAPVQPQQIKEDKVKVAAWNKFAQQLLALSKKITARQPTQNTESEGKYGGAAGSKYGYRRVDYVDKTTGKLLSRVQWDRDKPDQLQEIEVNIYDSQGRLMRDFLAAYLPWSHNAPVQTVINLHQYNNGLHAFRQFDASGELLFEKCTGEFKGRSVDLTLEDYEIDDKVTATPDYRACFKGLQKTAGEYLLPH
jgi:hypothetical protein